MAEEKKGGGAVVYMAVPRCDACLWWVPHWTGIGDCTLFELDKREKVHEMAKLIVTATLSGQAVVATHAEFGCVQWEAKK